MDYAATIDFLFSQLPLFSRIGPAAYKKDLDNIRALCTHLGNPQLKFRCIHVGGTNGKGSVSHMLAAVLQESGYKTGLYTSPHLYDFRERIRINGALCTEAFVVDFTERIRPLIAELQPSFFEITVAMAFEYFAQQEVDVAVIEVGLGGRLDSTNIITPVLSVITNIGWDHMNLLGNTLAEIAAEKAGIIKPGVPVVVGARTAETEPVFRSVAEAGNSPLYFADAEFLATTHEAGARFRSFDVLDLRTQQRERLQLDLPGRYQEQNLATVMTALRLLPEAGFATGPAQYLRALPAAARSTGLMGRWEVLRERPLLVLDVAHNADGLQQLRRQLEELPHARLHLVFGMVRDKDVATVFPLLPKGADYYFTQAPIPRALPVPELEAAAAAEGLRGRPFGSVNEAVEAALAAAAPEDLVLVCGSIFLVAEVDRARFSRP
ncbi:MAG: bifunctional folylpolyglutamate synthase/dihydrofolate synthase [Chitinophagaceae bacterium]|nr:MAG: bifunctional folylpolyglutamate synthase/dihydrofolate synthase [Chitinophagaceae bacterium]